LNIWILIFSFLVFSSAQAFAEPYVVDSKLNIEKYVSGLEFPTSMTFIENDILVLEKNTGNVRLIKNGELQQEPVLHVNVLNSWETGLLGITTLGSKVFLYFTEVEDPSSFSSNEDKVLGNRIYSYTWNGNTLQNGILIKELPFDLNVERSIHSGGAMVTGLDGTVYSVTGDTQRRGALQNLDTGNFTDSGIILKVNYDDSILKPSESQNPLDHYYAMGIRNSFGLAIDPITGYLWDTENGDDRFDEINLVEPKFNSGWTKIMGPATAEKIANLPTNGFQYSNPEFSWYHSVAPTALIFVNSNLFKNYNESLLVGDFNYGAIYHFKLNSERNGFIFDDPALEDLVLDNNDSLNDIIFASDFSGITDLEFGSDGLLYVLSPGDGGSIYRIFPVDSENQIDAIEIPKWIKNNARWWFEGFITDNEFIHSLEYLLEHKIIKIPTLSLPETQSIQQIPFWVKENVGLWANEKITDMEFASGIQFLMKKGIVKIQLGFCDKMPSSHVNLSGCNLSNKSFSKLDLKLANFTNTVLKNVDFSKTDLRSAIFENAILSGADLSNSQLNLASFRNSDLSDANLSNSKLSRSTFEKTIFSGTDFSKAKLLSSKMIKAEITNTNFTEAVIFSNLEGATISDSDFSKAKMQRIFLVNADLSNVNLSNANLLKANFSGAYLKDVNLQGSNLEKADFRYANLQGVDLTGASLIYTDLSYANLENVIIEGVDFSTAETKFCNGCP